MPQITRYNSSFLILLLLLGTCSVARARLPIPDPPSFTSHSYVLMGYKSRQIIASKNPNKDVEPASLTKMMTAYIVFSEIKQGNISLDDKVKISKKAWKTGGSTMFLNVGDHVPVKLLLHGLITQSGNDAAVALAEYVAGSTTTFATYMNQYAKKLGLVDSHFKNPDGLPVDGHVMSAHDIARLSADIIRDFPKMYQQFFHQKEFTYGNIKQYNRNSLLWSDPSADGLKTGHTKEAGYCLAASAKRKDMRLIAVVTGTPSDDARTSDAEALLNYGFRFYRAYKLFPEGKAISKVRVWKGAQDTVSLVAKGAVYVLALRGQKDHLTVSAKLPNQLMAPVKKGQKIGKLEISYAKHVLKTVPLFAGKDVATGNLFDRLKDDVLLMFQ